MRKFPMVFFIFSADGMTKNRLLDDLAMLVEGFDLIKLAVEKPIPVARSRGVKKNTGDEQEEPFVKQYEWPQQKIRNYPLVI